MIYNNNTAPYYNIWAVSVLFQKIEKCFCIWGYRSIQFQFIIMKFSLMWFVWSYKSCFFFHENNGLDKLIYENLEMTANRTDPFHCCQIFTFPLNIYFWQLLPSFIFLLFVLSTHTTQLQLKRGTPVQEKKILIIVNELLL